MLDDLFGSVGLKAPDAILFSISATGVTPVYAAFGLGAEVLLIRNYGFVNYAEGAFGVGVANTWSINIEPGFVWGLNGNPKRYTGFFIQAQVSNKKMIGGSFFFSPKGTPAGFKGGLSLGKGPSGVIMLEYYTRIWDPKDGYFPDIKEAHFNLLRAIERLDDNIINLYNPSIPDPRR